jgi:hypothetical protein
MDKLGRIVKTAVAGNLHYDYRRCCRNTCSRTASARSCTNSST